MTNDEECFESVVLTMHDFNSFKLWSAAWAVMDSLTVMSDDVCRTLDLPAETVMREGAWAVVDYQEQAYPDLVAEWERPMSWR